MKSQNIWRWMVVGAIVLIGIGYQLSMAQEADRNDSPFAAGPSADGAVGPPADAPRFEKRLLIDAAGEADPFERKFKVRQQMVDMNSAIREASEQLRDAEGEEAKEKAESNLRDLLKRYFDDDLKRREGELKRMEDRLAKLQQQLERRRSKMDEIIDLQVKVLVNQANGLGFFNDAPASDAVPSIDRDVFFFKQGPKVIRRFSDGPEAAAGATFEVSVPTPPIALPAQAAPVALPTPAVPAEPPREPIEPRDTR